LPTRGLIPEHRAHAELVLHREEPALRALGQIIGVALYARELADHLLQPRHVAAPEAHIDQLVEPVDRPLGQLARHQHPPHQLEQRLDQLLGDHHAALVRELRDVLGHVGNRVLVVENLQRVAPPDRHEQAPREVTANLVLEIVCLVLETVDLLPVGRQLRRVARGHVLEQREHPPRAGHGDLHVLLHGPDRRASEQISHQRHGAYLQVRG
jgi:hypothetical protein